MYLCLPAVVITSARRSDRHPPNKPGDGQCVDLIHQHGHVAPDWPTGLALGLGSLAGAYARARIQSRLPDLLIRRVMGILILAIGVRYLVASAS
jgi:hypothetical protein